MMIRKVLAVVFLCLSGSVWAEDNGSESDPTTGWFVTSKNPLNWIHIHDEERYQAAKEAKAAWEKVNLHSGIDTLIENAEFLHNRIQETVQADALALADSASYLFLTYRHVLDSHMPKANEECGCNEYRPTRYAVRFKDAEGEEAGTVDSAPLDHFMMNEWTVIRENASSELDDASDVLSDAQALYEAAKKEVDSLNRRTKAASMKDKQEEDETAAENVKASSGSVSVAVSEADSREFSRVDGATMYLVVAGGNDSDELDYRSLADVETGIGTYFEKSFRLKQTELDMRKNGPEPLTESEESSPATVEALRSALNLELDSIQDIRDKVSEYMDLSKRILDPDLSDDRKLILARARLDVATAVRDIAAERVRHFRHLIGSLDWICRVSRTAKGNFRLAVTEGLNETGSKGSLFSTAHKLAAQASGPLTAGQHEGSDRLDKAASYMYHARQAVRFDALQSWLLSWYSYKRLLEAHVHELRVEKIKRREESELVGRGIAMLESYHSGGITPEEIAQIWLAVSGVTIAAHDVFEF